MTNYKVLNEKYFKENKEINILLNDCGEAKIIDLNIKRIIYFNEEYDTTIIELKEEDKIKKYLELDDNLFKDNEKVFYEDKPIYIIQYPKGTNGEEEACVSYGILNRINIYNIIHVCSTENGTSGSPILNLKNNKVIGKHKGTPDYTKNFNHGTLLKFPLNDFINKNKIKNDIVNTNKIKNDFNNINEIKNDFNNINEIKNDFINKNKIKNNSTNKNDAKNDFINKNKSKSIIISKIYINKNNLKKNGRK